LSAPTLKLRSAGVWLRRQQVLLHRGAEDDFWTLPGGTVEPGERSDQALCREIAEELGIDDARAVRLLWFAESRFSYLGRRYHEIGFYWLLDAPERVWPNDGGEFTVLEPRIIFRWVALDDLAAWPIKPAFLVAGLAALPPTAVYLQVDE